MDAALPDVTRLDLWEVEQARLSLFVTERPANFRELWAATRGDEPQSESMDRSGPYPIFRASGPFNDNQLTLQVEPNRVDWVLTDNPTSQVLPPYFSTGPYMEVTRTFYDFARAFVDSNDLPIIRVALGFILIRYVPNREAGYNFLNEYLSSTLHVMPHSKVSLPSGRVKARGFL
jgi:hypothetical protein